MDGRTDGHTDRQTDIQTDRQTDIQTYRRTTDGQTYRLVCFLFVCYWFTLLVY